MIVVRPAGPADVDAAAAVHDAGRRAYYAAGGTDVGPPDPRRRETWQALVADPDRGVWLAERTGLVVGVLAAGRPVHPQPAGPQVLELIALFVDPTAWGCGAGGALHDVFTGRLGSGTESAGVLEVWDRNDRARVFYAHRGWQADGRSRPAETGGCYLGLQLPSAG